MLLGGHGFLYAGYVLNWHLTVRQKTISCKKPEIWLGEQNEIDVTLINRPRSSSIAPWLRPTEVGGDQHRGSEEALFTARDEF